MLPFWFKKWSKNNISPKFTNIFKRKKPTFEFISVIPGVNRLMPIVPASDIKHKWVSKAAKSFADFREQNPDWQTRFFRNQTIKCPAVFKTQRMGWVLRAWQDLVIVTNGDNTTVEWRHPFKTSHEHLSVHPPEQFYNFMENWRDNTMHVVLKYHSFWRVVVPKDYYLLEMPVAFSDENRFSVIPGVFDGSLGTLQMNVQMLWHVPNGTTIIKQGTPIAQYIPIKKSECDFISREQFDYDPDIILQSLIDNSVFVRNYKETSNFYNHLED